MWFGYEDLAVLALAVLLDLAFGEPHYRLHPTVWIGHTVGLADRLSPRSRVAGTIAGGVAALAVPALWAAMAYLVVVGLRNIGGLADYWAGFGWWQVQDAAYVIVSAALLKTTFSVKMLRQVAEQVRDALASGDMAQVRGMMGSLVSRDPSQLTAEQATAATVESVSENMSDSFIGPWLAFALFGLPGAFAYRAINTLDSMIGYHGVYEYLGKVPARLDDLVNLIPSRLTGLLLVMAGAALPGQTAGGGVARHAAGPRAHRKPQRRVEHEQHGGRSRRGVGEGGPLPAGRPGQAAGTGGHHAGGAVDALGGGVGTAAGPGAGGGSGHAVLTGRVYWSLVTVSSTGRIWIPVLRFGSPQPNEQLFPEG